MSRFLSVTAALCLAAGAQAQDPKVLAIPAADIALAKRLAVELDDDDRETRERASAELARLGRRALPVLKETLAGKPSPEVRRRVNELLPAARVADFIAGTPVFLADTDGKFKHQFEVWDFLREVAGDNDGSRKLMRVILSEKANAKVLRAALGDGEDPLLVFFERWLAIKDEVYAAALERPKPDPLLPIAPVAGLLLAEALRPGAHEKMYNVRGLPIQYAFTHPSALKAVAGEGEYGGALRKVILWWVDSRDTAAELNHIHPLTKSLQLGSDYPARIYERILKLSECEPRSISNTITNAASDSDPKWLALFERHLTDRRVSQPAHRNLPEMEVRDVALFYLVMLTKQKPTEYGFTQVQKGGIMDTFVGGYGFVETRTGTAQEHREAGLKKWAEWSKANLKAERKK